MPDGAGRALFGVRVEGTLPPAVLLTTDLVKAEVQNRVLAPVSKTITLTPEERKDVRHAMTEAGLPSGSKAEGYETEDAYLTRIDQPGAEVTDSTLLSFREARYKANSASGRQEGAGPTGGVVQSLDGIWWDHQ